jgi:predicted nicotinamide N-methyase
LRLTRPGARSTVARRALRCTAVALDLVARTVEVGGRHLSLLVPRSAEAVLDDVLDAGDTVPPYWADLWPSARALAAHLLERDDLAGARVLELACGVGLPSVAALLQGADVTASDVAPVAVRIAARNARRCGRRRLTPLVVDLLDPPAELLELAAFDVVLAADVLYRPELGRGLAALLPHVVAHGGEAIVVHPFAGQGDELVATLTGAGWHAARDDLPVPGWLDGRSTVHRIVLSRASR